MKITKRQLKKIIKEEKAKILKENPQQTLRELDQISFQFEEEINARMSVIDRRWYKNPEIMVQIVKMLDELKAQMQEYSRMQR